MSSSTTSIATIFGPRITPQNASLFAIRQNPCQKLIQDLFNIIGSQGSRATLFDTKQIASWSVSQLCNNLAEVIIFLLNQEKTSSNTELHPFIDEVVEKSGKVIVRLGNSEKYKNESLQSILVLVRRIVGECLYLSFAKDPIGATVFREDRVFTQAGEVQASGVELPSTMPSFNCLDFAFLTLNEPRALQTIFAGRTFPEELWNQPEVFLPKWGYRISTTPEKGDLVVFLGPKDLNRPYHNGTRVKHFAVVDEEGKLLSKWGQEGIIFRLEIDKHPAYFGAKVLFFHKSQGDGFLQEVVDLIARLNAFPRCLRNVKHFRCELVSLVQRKERAALETGPFNKKYYQLVKAEFARRLKGFSSDSNASHAHLIQQIAIEVFDAISIFQRP